MAESSGIGRRLRPKKAGKVTLAACLIVKNERDNLPRCLKSLKGFVDKIVIVDTGSEDNTIEIAKSFGAEVHVHPWENDFSLHRNQSIGYADTDWVFIIDADEEAEYEHGVEEARRQFEMLVDYHDAIAIRAKDIQKGRVAMQFFTTRLFCNGTVHYEGVIHNQPITKSKAVFFSLVNTRHYGYDITAEAKAEKARRTVGLLKERLAKDSKDHACHFYLSQIFADMGDCRGCTREGEAYLAARPELEPKGLYNTSVYYTIAHNYMKLGDMKRGGEWLFIGLTELPEDLDLSLCLIEYGKTAQQSDLVVNGAKKFIALYQKHKADPLLQGNRFVYSNNPEAFCFACFILLEERMQDVSPVLELISSTLPETAEPFQKKFRANFQRDLGHLGLCLDTAEEGGTSDGSNHL